MIALAGAIVLGLAAASNARRWWDPYDAA